MDGHAVKKPAWLESARQGRQRAEFTGRAVPEEHGVIGPPAHLGRLLDEELIQTDVQIAPVPANRECAGSRENELVVRYREHRVAPVGRTGILLQEHDRDSLS